MSLWFVIPTLIVTGIGYAIYREHRHANLPRTRRKALELKVTQMRVELIHLQQDLRALRTEEGIDGTEDGDDGIDDAVAEATADGMRTRPRPRPRTVASN